MNTIEDTIEAARLRSYRTCNLDLLRPNRKKDLLLIPRKKLKLNRKMNGTHLSKSFFIEERLKERDTKLDKPTQQTGTGLSSGLRSCIILDSNGRYLKIKGVAPKTHNSQGGDRGFCDATESMFEIMQIQGLVKANFYLPITPAFVEAILSPNQNLSLEETIRFNSKNKFTKTSGNLLNSSKEAKKYEEFMSQFEFGDKKEKYFFPTAFHILGDTRLDEVIYHLTKKRLTGEKKLDRDKLLLDLSFYAGSEKASLTTSGLAWGTSLKRTNNHIGNFVIYEDSFGLPRVSLVDFSTISFEKNFENQEKFNDHLDAELASFREDFFDVTASSFGSYLPYRNFSESLRAQCFNALKTGYVSTLEFVREKHKLVFPIPSKVKNPHVPDTNPLSVKDFKEIYDRSTN